MVVGEEDLIGICVGYSFFIFFQFTMKKYENYQEKYYLNIMPDMILDSMI